MLVTNSDLPVFDVILTGFGCGDLIGELLTEDYPGLDPDVAACYAETMITDADIMAVHILGTRNGAKFEDVYPEAAVQRFYLGLEKSDALILSCS